MSQRPEDLPDSELNRMVSEQKVEGKKTGYIGYVRNGYTVLIGPNKKSPSLVDCAVVGSDICLMGVDPAIAAEAVNSLVDKLLAKSLSV